MSPPSHFSIPTKTFRAIFESGYEAIYILDSTIFGAQLGRLTTTSTAPVYHVLSFSLLPVPKRFGSRVSSCLRHSH